MRLTEEQAQVVADNHDLIYWYIHKNNLSVDEWYDIFAIELCYAVMTHNPERGSLSNYFKLRCDWVFCEIIQKQRDRSVEEFTSDYLDGNETSYDGAEHILDQLEIEKLFQEKNGDIYKLIYEGYTQSEIAKIIGKRQATISRTLKRVRKSNVHRQRDS